MLLKKQAIGVFDSGLGGISVLSELKKRMPNEDYIYFGDSSFAPYGEKTRDEITKRCQYICEYLISRGVKMIVIACNTATSACIQQLRQAYKEISIIGMEPALKVVAEGKVDQRILVMATNFTLKETRFEKLVLKYSESNEIYKQPCPKLVEIVEHEQLDNALYVMEILREYLDAYEGNTLNSIVLGCTHFAFYKKQIEALIGKDTLLMDGNYGTARHVQDVLLKQNLLQDQNHIGNIQIYNSMEDRDLIKMSKKLLNRGE